MCFREDIGELQDRIMEAKEEYQSITQDSADGVSAVPIFAVNDRFSLNKEEAAYMLSIELILPIDYVLLQVRLDCKMDFCSPEILNWTSLKTILVRVKRA